MRERQENPMVEPLQAAAVANELRLLDFIDQNSPQKPCNRIETARKNPNALVIFDELLDSSVDSITGLPSPPPPPLLLKRSPACDELNEAALADEEEELEWLSNKDAFPSLETSFEITTNNASPVSVLPPSFKVPVKARSKVSRKKRRIFPPIRAPPPPPPAEGKERRRCRHCEVEETPQWRMGPEGPKTLCNACGVRFKKGRLFPEYRPANSPTFSAAIHSNSTRRIMEMRLGTGRPGKRGRLRLAVM